MRGRKLSREEAQLWAQVARTVKPLVRRNSSRIGGAGDAGPGSLGGPAQPADAARSDTVAVTGKVSVASGTASQSRTIGSAARIGEVKRQLDRHGLDASWDKKLARAALHPDFTLDLHGHSLDAAYLRLDHGLAQAWALGARLVLVITGRPRPTEAADRGDRRGAIRAKIMDWLEHGPHADRIAAVRPAHRRHGGAGALYLVMKKPR